ncbi:uncharacterized protein BCR38DRAFT_404350 [Pseudomassariella vexata]|uniref:Uncharacterized protein n=1 Tax=Pseudomassariella vexata TaxID=1141098 RepID=A0A1Y2EI37_9PEZI|nr:uncharacterized protein BCR38DRAFT_404350 [Pseudomassariella vexata]ORY71239.1 hypothetical protein BCR38DRAFT_404350 [Pseudomassariella vexata]
MTQSVLGSSLLQTQDVHSPNYSHGRSSEDSHHHNHHNHHNHIRSHNKFHNRRHDEYDSSVVQVIQTISIVQVIDSSGATVDVHTLSQPTTTALADTAVVDVSILNELGTTAGTSDDVTSLYSALLPTTASSPVESVPLSMSSSTPSVATSAIVTPAPSSPDPSVFPSVGSGISNSTQVTPSSLLSNGTVISSTTSSTANLTTSVLPNSSGTVIFNSTFTTTLEPSGSLSSTITASSSLPTTFFSGTATSTGGNDGGFAGGATDGATGTVSPSSTSTAGSGSGSSSSDTSTATIAGSVLGAVAGVAFILVLALMALRWKKRQNALRLSSGENSARGGFLSGTGGAAAAAAAAAGRPSTARSRGMSGTMVERRSVPFAVPAALATLTAGYKRFSGRTTASSIEGNEKGFQKVAGRKLPSVLQHGGDGYSEPSPPPHDSISSEQSFYRDSQGFFGGPEMPRLAVGSPMRPESGVPIFHPGPAKTPVTEQARFSPTLSPPQRDPLGRSRPSMDGSSRSHGSGSRFTEEI